MRNSFRFQNTATTTPEHPLTRFPSFYSPSCNLAITGTLHNRQSFYNRDPKIVTMPSQAAFSIYVFGLTSFIAGVFSLLAPESATAELGFPPIRIPVARGNSLAAIAMGIYYTLAAYQDNKAFFALTVPMRLLTTAVFWSQEWTAPAIWEGSGALLTLSALTFSAWAGDGRKG
jgi:hypothetical protein